MLLPIAGLSTLAQRFAPVLPIAAWAFALVLAAWVASELLLRALTPAPVHATPHALPAPTIAAQEIAGSALFAEGGPATEANAAPVENTAYRLLGVATGFGDGPGFAILQSGAGAPRAVLVGDRLSPGETLHRVLPDRVEIMRAGVLSSLALERGSAHARSAAAEPILEED
ncbi:type II secretion system protein N [Thauera phenolivorans]|uniref:type II secretion system protein N n=1 Tax=Thauera phenolivorans TaxID=1792543 RepID=UPI0013014433|nr:type II secretion system protein N [Thauera phenolivorans]